MLNRNNLQSNFTDEETKVQKSGINSLSINQLLDVRAEIQTHKIFSYIST